jgi:hypothetical protein
MPRDGSLTLSDLHRRVICHLYAAPLDIDPFSERAVREANPAFDFFQNQAELRAMAATARRMPALAAM